MRRAVILGLIGAFAIAGAAYGATTVTNVYTVHGRVIPVKSGVKTHPKPAGGHISFTVSTNPSGDRPNIIKTIVLRVQGLIENTKRLPACRIARLTNPAEGPASCPKHSLAGKGHLIADISKQGDQTPSGHVTTCRVELYIYNGGNHDLSYYVFAKAVQPPKNECPSSGPAAFKPVAFVATLTATSKGLVESATFPQALLHPTIAGTTYDAALIKSSVTIIQQSKRVATIPHFIGLFATNFCPANGKRQVALTFRQENGSSKTVTKLVKCEH
jgi:hypothetical protein